MTSLNKRIAEAVGAKDWKDQCLEAAEALLELVPELQTKGDAIRQAAKERRAMPLPDDAALAVPPQEVIVALDDIQRIERTLSFDLTTIAAYVTSRTPEMKDEDNAGVRVQEGLLELLSQLQQLISNGGTGGSNGGEPRLISLRSKQEYLGKRADLEMKLAPVGKDAAAPTSASLRLQIADLDASVLGKVAQTYASLRVTTLMLVNFIGQNWKKVQEPRRANVGMVG